MNCPAEFESKTTAHPGWLIGGGALVVVLVSLLVFAALRYFLPSKEYEDVYVFVSQIALTLCLFLFIREIGINILAVMRDWWKNKTEHLRIVVKYCLFYFGLTAAVVGVLLAATLLLDKAGMISLSASMGAFKAATPDTMGSLKSIMVKSPPRFILSLLAMCVFAPIIEEVFFRRFLFVALRKGMNFAPSLLISSVLFSLLHPSVIQGALGGLYLGYVYEKGKSLPANILIHSMVNIATIVVTLLIGK